MKNHAQLGLKNEDDIVNYLNSKPLKSLNNKWREHIRAIFPFAKDDDVVFCYKFFNHQSKPDIAIKIRHSNAYVSIKSGKNPSIHEENFFSFLKFLRQIGVSERTLTIIKFYHFGETSKLNNSGKPFSKEEMQTRFGKFFLQANEELDNPKIIEEVIERTIFKGALKKRTSAEYLYYGSIDNGFLLNREEIYSLIFSYRQHENRPIHFGALNYQPAGRKRTSIDYRYVRIKWPLLCLMFYKGKEINPNDIHFKRKMN